MRNHFKLASRRSDNMPKKECVPTFSGMAQGALPRATRWRSQRVKRLANAFGSSAAISGAPGLKWSYTFSKSFAPSLTSPATRCQRLALLLSSATRTMSSNAIHSANQRAISRVMA